MLAHRLLVVGMMLSHWLLVAGIILAHRLLVAGMMLSHRLLIAGIMLARGLLVVSVMLAPKSKCYVPGSFEMKLCLFASYTYKRKSIRVFRRPILVYPDGSGVEIHLLSTVSISNCKCQKAPGDVV